MTALKLIKKFYGPGTSGEQAYDTLIRHSEAVAERATLIARKVDGADVALVEESAMLHDIGVFMTHAPGLGCLGDAPYIQHGVLGRELLEREGFATANALVCERHVGAGLTAPEARVLGLPERDMLPVSVEEKIVCVADKLFTKSAGGRELTIAEALKSVERYGEANHKRFKEWLQELGL